MHKCEYAYQLSRALGLSLSRAAASPGGEPVKAQIARLPQQV